MVLTGDRPDLLGPLCVRRLFGDPLLCGAEVQVGARQPHGIPEHATAHRRVPAVEHHLLPDQPPHRFRHQFARDSAPGALDLAVALPEHRRTEEELVVPRFADDHESTIAVVHDVSEARHARFRAGVCFDEGRLQHLLARDHQATTLTHQH